MSLLEKFMHYAAEFEKTYVDDDWSRLEPFFTEHAVYEVTGLDTFDGRAEGREAVLAMIRTAVDRFDRQLDRRDLELTSKPEVTDDSVTIHWAVTYGPAGSELRLSGSEQAVYEDGLIVLLKDTYSAAMQQQLDAWLAEHGGQSDQ